VDDPAVVSMSRDVVLQETKNADLVLALRTTTSGIKILTDMTYFNPLLKFYQNTPARKLSSLLTLLRQHKTCEQFSRFVLWGLKQKYRTASTSRQNETKRRLKTSVNTACVWMCVTSRSAPTKP
jgi:hypothetical protein